MGTNRHSLEEIRIPTLLLSGRYDEGTPICVEIHQRISGSGWVLSEHSSTSPIWKKRNDLCRC